MSFDSTTPPIIQIGDQGLDVTVNRLPPSDKPENPLYTRLEVLLNNKIGHQFQITKSPDQLEYQIRPRRGQEKYCDLSIAEFQIRDFFEGFHSHEEFIRYNGRTDFIKSKEVSREIKSFFADSEFEFKSKAGNTIEAAYGNHSVVVTWSFLRGDASKQFDFNWQLETSDYLDAHNQVRKSMGLEPAKKVSLFSESQYYDRPKSIPKLYDVANNREIVHASRNYLTYLKSKILHILHTGLDSESIIYLIDKRIATTNHTRNEIDYYSKLLIHSEFKQIGIEEYSVEFLNRNFKNASVKRHIEKLVELIGSS